VPNRSRLVLAALLLTVAVACGDDDDPVAATSNSTATTVSVPATVSPTTAAGDGDDGLPPGDDDGLEEIFQPFFEPLGLTFTYGSVVNFGGGMHLALYVEPTDEATAEQYLDRLVSSSAAIIPFLFSEFPRLSSFDLCQEPIPTGPDDPEQPEPRTVVLLTREQAASVDDWSTATLVDMLRAAQVGRGGHVDVDADIEALPAYVEAQAEAATPG